MNRSPRPSAGRTGPAVGQPTAPLVTLAAFAVLVVLAVVVGWQAGRVLAPVVPIPIPTSSTHHQPLAETP